MHLLKACLLSLVSVASFVLSPLAAQDSADTSPPLRWWRGNLHTHSLWSDGDDFPEMIAAWYLDHGYNFLALSDHNVLSDGQRWMPLEKIVDRGGKEVLPKYVKRFGKAWVETRGEEGTAKYEVRLKPLDEFRSLVEQSGKFLMIPAEEISDKAEGKPVHMNATNIREVLKPLGGETVRAVMENNLRLVLEHERETGREILPHLNHPNFGYAVTAEDLAAVVAEKFFEIHNGHPGVNQLGDEHHISIERMWDVANTIRIQSLDAPPLFGVATDDSHNYHGKPGAHTGRGWVMVRSRYLTPEHLIRAMKAGDFYASSGVTLSDVVLDRKNATIKIDVQPVEGETYRIDFIATLAPDAQAVSGSSSDKPLSLGGIAPEQVGKVVKSVDGVHGEYRMTGKELYVRAVVTSSAAPVDPSIKDQKKQAWTQPVMP
ncbi:MAG: PHP domain-containing protein [Aureliella sp.]